MSQRSMFVSGVSAPKNPKRASEALTVEPHDGVARAHAEEEQDGPQAGLEADGELASRRTARPLLAHVAVPIRSSTTTGMTRLVRA